MDEMKTKGINGNDRIPVVKDGKRTLLEEISENLGPSNEEHSRGLKLSQFTVKVLGPKSEEEILFKDGLIVGQGLEEQIQKSRNFGRHSD